MRPRVLSRAEPGQASVLGSEHARREEVAHGGALLVANGKADARGLGRADLAVRARWQPSRAGKTYSGRDLLPDDMAVASRIFP